MSDRAINYYFTAKLILIGVLLFSAGCGYPPDQSEILRSDPARYVLVWAGDADEKDSDFFAVIDVEPGSARYGQVIATELVGLTASLPHHLEYTLPPRGELLFGNAHKHEVTLLIDTTDPVSPKVIRTFAPPPPLRFPHDYHRLSNGNMLVGYLRSDGPSPKLGDPTMPGGHGGIAEYDPEGRFLRAVSAEAEGIEEPIRPYALVSFLDQDRIVTTSAPMMEPHSADVVQIWRYSDFKLLHTIPVPPGKRSDGSELPGAARFPFGPRIITDGSVFLNAYGCGFYHLTGVDTESPSLTNVYTIQVADPDEPDGVRGSCGTPVVTGQYWIMPVGQEHTVVVLDISDPSNPKEVSRLDTATDFNPHWLAKDPGSNRLILGAELGGESGMLMLLVDPVSGHLSFDETFQSVQGQPGMDFNRERWPHGTTGEAWGHAALFLP